MTNFHIFVLLFSTFIIDRAVLGNQNGNKYYPSPFSLIQKVRKGGSTYHNTDSSDVTSFEVSVSSIRGKRTYMEDEYLVMDGNRFCAIFDGHGGSAVSLYLRQNLYANYLQCLAAAVTTSTDDNSTRKKNTGKNTPSLDTCIQSLKLALKNIDDQVQQVSHWSYQGSTAVVVLLYPHSSGNQNDEISENKSIYEKDNMKSNSLTIASFNIGDSRAVLSSSNIVTSRNKRKYNSHSTKSNNDQALSLTEDHKPNSPSEKRRIEKLGGQVNWCGQIDPISQKPILSSGVYRMNGNLALSRSIGDRSERPCVSSEPDIQIFDIVTSKRPKNSYGGIKDYESDSESKDESYDVEHIMYDVEADEEEEEIYEDGNQFIVLASDGLFDVMSNQEICDFINNSLDSTIEDIERNKNEMNNMPTSWSKQTKLDKAEILQEKALKHVKSRMASNLSDEALRRGSTDNITIIIIWLTTTTSQYHHHNHIEFEEEIDNL